MTDHMTPETLDAIRARLAAATPGEWVMDGLADYVNLCTFRVAAPGVGNIAQYLTALDAELIAHAPDDLRDLLALVDAQQQQIADAERLRANEISCARSDARSECILDMRRYLAEGLRKLGISANDKISLTEVLDLFRYMQAKNVRLTQEAETLRNIHATDQTRLAQLADELAALTQESTNQLAEAYWQPDEHGGGWNECRFCSKGPIRNSTLKTYPHEVDCPGAKYTGEYNG